MDRTDRHLNVAVSRGQSLGPSARLEETSNHPPAVCAVGNQLFLAWTGTDRRLNVMAFTGDTTGSPIHVDETSSDGPSLCALGPTSPWPGPGPIAGSTSYDPNKDDSVTR